VTQSFENKLEKWILSKQNTQSLQTNDKQTNRRATVYSSTFAKRQLRIFQKCGLFYVLLPNFVWK